ncbi:hypothetical protein DM02DRAFT_531006 [Periconia macrospinosa]|uniref:Luciferase domain-containing protein n=1 Tax=Periconia macrospinosa TaxID=97972 RepID=A0A2V1DMZ1_9PLEO|nr:hypothetical protein DM02DRAFT_531006 [Periconia macrospinosa]
MPTATATTGLFSSFLIWCFKDYRAYLALGPGGPPYNLKGWAWITFGIRPFALSQSGVTLVTDYPAEGGHLAMERLPHRRGPRATLGGIAPHRQLSQHPPEIMRNQIISLFQRAATQYPDILSLRKSLYERHHDALFVSQKHLESGDPSIPETSIISRGEIGHMHPDMSVHLYLSPADARQAITKEWAERHRLAVPRDSWVKNKYAVADTYLMIYGSRDEGELAHLKVMVESAICFMTGREGIKIV